MKVMNIQSLVIDRGTQSRAKINEETVAEYAEAMAEGVEFPPVIVFFDGVEYFLGDGFHRLHAVRKLGKTSIAVDVRTGTLRDAIKHSLGANDDHGLRRSNEDKRKCVQTLLDDFEWQSLSVAEMAKICHVSAQMVRAVKQGIDSGEKVSTTKIYPPKAKPVKLNNVIESPVEPPVIDDAVTELVAENQRLSDRLAVEVMDASEEEKLLASETITDLREQIRVLEIENQSLKIARDTFQRENAELKKTISSLKRQIKNAQAA